MPHSAFRDIRALRSSPPLAAADGERRRMFSAALQQTEDLFAAAAAAGPAAKPLPLFYALSQAGRAIAAGQYPEHDGWKIQGHGLRSVAEPERGVAGTSVIVQPSKRDAPTVVAAALDSPALAGRMTVADLVAALPEIPRGRLGEGAVTACAIEPQDDSPWSRILPGAQGAVWVKLGPDRDPDAALQRYAGIQGYEHLVPPRLDAEHELAHVLLRWPRRDVEPSPSRRALRSISEVARQVNDRWYLQPALGDAEGRVDRLLIWWALLFAFAHLARYQPMEWVAALDVDVSGEAVGIEDVLRVAEEVLPQLIAQALGRSGAAPRALEQRLLQEHLAELESRPSEP